MLTALRSAEADGLRPAAALVGDEVADEALMAAVRDGDRAAYRLLVQRHLGRVFGLARRLSGDAAEAEDVAQDVFLQIWRRRAAWSDDGARFTTWLYRAVVNRVIDHRRRPQNDDIDAVEEPAAAGPDAVDRLHRRQVADRLRRAQEKLPPQQRVAITLYYFQGLSAQEVASIMQLSVGAVESLLKRARQNLRQSLKASAQAVRDSFDDG